MSSPTPRPHEDAAFLSVAQTAVVLGVSERTVRRMVARGDLPVWRWGSGPKGKGIVRVPKAALRDFIISRQP